MPLPHLYLTSPRGQCAVVLLAALRDLYVNDGRGTVTKREAIEFIRCRHWFALEQEDNEPYPSQQLLSHEPRWHTLIAWSRKDSVIVDLMSYEARDSWGLTRRGRNTIDRVQRQYSSGELHVAPCYLWSANFKSYMCPGYVVSASDAKRPANFYRDNQIFEIY
jgi:hypothetical protein